jgi:hypothetical protein
LKAEEIGTLIHLLEDPDPEVYSIISTRLAEQGPAVITALKRALNASSNSLQQERVKNILQYLQSNAAMQGLENWLQHGYGNLLEGAYWLAKHSYPDLQLEDLQAVVDDIVKDMMINLQDNMSPEEKIKTLDFFFFRYHHFRLSDKEILQPQHNYINHVVKSHTGSLVSLTLLYLHVGQQAGLPLQAVCMPNSFILAYTEDNGELLFYLHILQQGAKLFRKDVDLYFRRSNITPKEHYYLPKPNTNALLYLLEMQIYCYEREGNPDKVDLFRRLLPRFGAEKSSFDELD